MKKFTIKEINEMLEKGEISISQSISMKINSRSNVTVKSTKPKIRLNNNRKRSSDITLKEAIIKVLENKPYSTDLEIIDAINANSEYSFNPNRVSTDRCVVSASLKGMVDRGEVLRDKEDLFRYFI